MDLHFSSLYEKIGGNVKYQNKIHCCTMSDLVIGTVAHRLELQPCPSPPETNAVVLDATNNTQILNYKWVETEIFNEQTSLDSFQQINSVKKSESTGDSSISVRNSEEFCSNNKSIPFNRLYPGVFDEVSQLIRSDGAFGCLIISEPGKHCVI